MRLVPSTGEFGSGPESVGVKCPPLGKRAMVDKALDGGGLMPTREESVAAAAKVLSRFYRVRCSYPIEETARRVVRLGCPT